MICTIKTLNPSRGFCHVIDPVTGEDIYVHATECNFDLAECIGGDELDVGRVVESEKGPRAESVIFHARPVGTVVTAKVTSVSSARGFAHARCVTDGRDIFLHTRDFADYRNGGSEAFAALCPGDLIECVLADSKPLPKGVQVALVAA